jgi:hypothetical protein
MDKMWKYVIQDAGEIKRQDKNVETMEFEVRSTLGRK